MKERPILFSGSMVKAILDGKKTVTRRVVKPQPDRVHDGHPYWFIGGYRAWRYCGTEDVLRMGGNEISCPYGQPGNQLWVREKWGTCAAFDNVAPRDLPGFVAIKYFADNQIVGATAGHGLMLKSRPSIHMPRSLSRITLEVTAVRVERLQDLSEADAIAEGVARTITGDGWRRYCTDPEQEACGLTPCGSAVASFRSLWESISGPSSWTANPWVWVVEFRRVP